MMLSPIPNHTAPAHERVSPRFHWSWRVLGLVCLLQAVLTAWTPAQTPAFTNGKFELGNTGGWSIYNPQSRPFTWAASSEKVHGGLFAGKLSRFDTAGNEATLRIINSASVRSLPAGTLVRVAFWIMTDGLTFTNPNHSIQPVLVSSNSVGTVLSYGTATGNFAGDYPYTEVEFLLELLPGATTVDCQLFVAGGISRGALYVDDMTIEVLSEPGPASAEGTLDCRVTPDGAGTPRLTINGKPEPPTFFFGNIGNPVVFDEVAKAATAGVRLIQFDLQMPWQGFSTGQFAAALKRNPNALFLPRISIFPTAQWLKAHPLPPIVNDTGTSLTYPSLASDELIAAWNHQLELMIRFLRRGPFKDRIIGFHPTYLSGGEWFYEDLANQYYDYSEVNRERFAKWAEARYGSLAALNTAWGTALDSLTSVTLPTASEWASGDDGFFRSPAKRRWVTDYQLYHNELVADRILELAALVKTASGGRALFCSFQGYQFELLGNGYQRGVGHSGHMALRRLLVSPDIDIIASPVSYFDRQPGGPSNLMGPEDSILLAGKLQLQEDDSRTHLWKTPAPEPSLVYPTEWDSLQCLRRNFGNVLSHNLAIWWMDLQANGNYDSPAIWQSNQKMVEAYADSIRRAVPTRPQVALIYDEETPYWIRQDSFDLSYYNGILQRSLFQTLGAQVGYYHIDDLERLPASVRLIVFVNTFRMDARERQLVQGVKSGGRTLLWLMAPGYIAEQAFSTDAMTSVTGFTLTRMNGSRLTTIKANDAFAPLTGGLANHVFGPPVAMKPTFKVGTGDSAVRILGTYTLDNTPALALKEHAGWNGIFCGSPLLSLPVLRAIARYAGVTLQADADRLDTADAVQTNGRYLCVYARDKAGRRSFQVPGELVPDGGFERATGTLPTAGFGKWVSPVSGTLTAPVAAGAGWGGSNGLKLGPFNNQAGAYNVPLGIDLAAREGTTYEISCRVLLSGLVASAAAPGDYIYLQFTPDAYSPATTVTFPLAEGKTVAQAQDQWLRLTGRYTHHAASADRPQLSIRLAISGAYQGEAIVLDDVSVREAGVSPVRVTDVLSGLRLANDATGWVDDFQLNEQKVYLIEPMEYSVARGWENYAGN